jgi:sugar phosphate isomerase/epimerase
MTDRLAASTNSYHPYSLEEALAGIAAAGFASVELTSVPGWTEHVRRDAGEEALAYVKDQLQRFGLEAISLSGHSDLVSDAGVAEFRKALRIARALGIGYVTTSTGGHDDASAGDLEDQRERFLARIGGLADEAADLGITICLETHGGLLATGVIAKALVEEIGKPNVGINYDPGNVIYYGDARPEIDLPLAVSAVKHIHCKDQIGGKGVWNFPAIGDGEVNFPALFATLRGEGFAGPISVEVEFTGEPWPSLDEVNDAMARSYRFVRPLLG